MGIVGGTPTCPHEHPWHVLPLLLPASEAQFPFRGYQPFCSEDSSPLGVPALRALPLPPAAGLGRVGQLEDKGLMGGLASGIRQCQKKDALCCLLAASVTDQQESTGQGRLSALGLLGSPPAKETVHSRHRPLQFYREEDARRTKTEAEAEAGPGFGPTAG